MKAILFLFLGLLMGFFMFALLPFLFLIWFDAYWRRHEVEALLSVLCDGGELLEEEPLPEPFAEWERKHLR